MKRIFNAATLVTLLVFLLMLTACGSREETEPVAETTASVPITASTEPVPSVSKGDDPAAAETGQVSADDTTPIPTPDLSGASLMADVENARPGESVTLTGVGFPAEMAVEVGIGPVASEYEIIETTQADENGRFIIQVSLYENAEPGQWVFVADVNNGKVTTDPLTVRATDMNQPGDGQFTRTQIYLTALEDNGQSGQPIGCNDSLVPVEIEIEPTIAPLTAALEQLLHLEDEYYGQSGLYNVFYQSDLSVDGIDIEDEQAIIALTGTLNLGGVCDNPRVMGQLEQTALQYNTISSVDISLNGKSLNALLSEQ